MKISVIIPVYNAEKYVGNAVESALQFDEVSEVILVEDKSPDNALEVCRNLENKHSRVKLFQHPDKENHGAGASRNLGIEKATGDFIAFLDADDFYLPNRFDAEKKLFENQEVEGVYGAIGVHYWSDAAREQYQKVYGKKLTTVYKKHPPEDVFPGLLGLRGSFGLFHMDAITIRKSALAKINELMNSTLRLHQDTDFLVRLSWYAALYPGIIDEAVAMRGIHESNRISQVDTKKIKPATTRVKLWKSLKDWSGTEARIPDDIKTHIRRMHRSFEIANADGIRKWQMILGGLLSDYKGIRSGLYNINFRKDLF